MIGKTDGVLQAKAIRRASGGIWGVLIGIATISLATPFVSARIFEKWFSFPAMLYLAPLPILSAMLLAALWRSLNQLKTSPKARGPWRPFAAVIALFTLAFSGMAYSFFPYVVPEQLTIYESASAPESLIIILVGTLFVLPTILGYTALSYYIFRGKATELRYD